MCRIVDLSEDTLPLQFRIILPPVQGETYEASKTIQDFTKSAFDL